MKFLNSFAAKAIYMEFKWKIAIYIYFEQFLAIAAFSCWPSDKYWSKLIKVEFASYIWVSYKIILKSFKTLNRICWAMECLFKALKCQIWLTNIKPFFWESEANIETLQNFSHYYWFSYKLVLKSVKSLNRILWAIEYWFKVLKHQTCLMNTKSFL